MLFICDEMNWPPLDGLIFGIIAPVCRARFAQRN